MKELEFDAAVIGAGPGGYVAALRAAQLGLSCAVIEREFIGGTCLNIGCIPSKALLDATHLVSRLRSASGFGIQVGEPQIDWPAMQKHKADVVRRLTAGVRGLLKKQGVRCLEGNGRFLEPGVIEVEGGGGKKTVVRAADVIIATGATEVALPETPFDGHKVVSSRAALEFDVVPDRLLVVGAGYIGLEIGSVYARLGSEVVILEMCGRVLPEMDAELAETAAVLLGSQGLDIRLGCRVRAVESIDERLEVRFERDGESDALSVDKVLVAVGRRPVFDGLGLAAIDLEINSRGFIVVDHGMRTSTARVYAVGDSVATPMLAHVAMDEGLVAAECIAGQDAAMDYRAVPAIVYTAPEIASVGLRQDEAEQGGRAVNVGRFPFRANGRALVRSETEGWVKILADAETDAILGVHCVGAEAGHLIHEAVVAMGYGGYAEDLALTVHAHPTLSEAFKEAALSVAGRALHI